MQKSIKKIIAGAIAALMVISSMPFTALAAPGDYNPDVQLQFSSFYDIDNDNGSWDSTDASGSDCYTSSGLGAFPLVYDAANGTLTGKAEDINVIQEYWGRDTVDEDWVLEAGNIFAVTIRIDNVDIAASGNINIRFSDNLTPAGLCSYKSGTKTRYMFASEDNLPDKLQKQFAGFRSPVPEFSASTIYPGMNDTALKDLSCIQEDPFAEDGDGWSDLMMTATLVCEGDHIDVSSVDPEFGFYDFVNHKIDLDDEEYIIGYTYDKQFIVATFVFELTDDTKPIQFALQDPEGKLDEKLDGAAFYASKAEGLGTENATTYAINKFNPDTLTNDGDTEWPGSAKMTFMGTNTNKGEVVPPHVHSYNAVVTDPTCTEQGYTTYTCECGDSYVDDYVDALNHAYEIDSIDWDTLDTATGEVTANFVCANDATHTTTETVQTTFEVTQAATEEQDELTTYTYAVGEFEDSTTVKTGEKLAHTHVPATAVVENEVPATCAAKGSYDEVVYCSKCGEELSRESKEIAKVAHTPAAAVVENEVPATCAAKGSYDEVVYCSVCNEELSRTAKEIEKIAHTPAAAVVENEVPATCAAKGSYDEVVYCSVCNEELSRTNKEIAKIAHTPAAAVVENEVPATCAAKGSYDEVVYCSVCNEELSRTAKEIEKVAHTPAAAVVENEVAPTKKDQGSYDEVVYCSVCNEELSRETKYVDALGVYIEIVKSDIGIITGLESGVKNHLAYGEEYSVTATPVDKAHFVGWEINGNIVSKEATYTATAFADLKITPVFEDDAATTITVTFYDKYGNTIKQYANYDVADYQAAIAADYATLTAPTYPGYTFTGWDKSEDDIKAISESATVWANYEKATEAQTYKVDVPDSVTFKANFDDSIDKNSVPYDTKVTVTDENAKAWKVNDVIVAYGTSYEFYVGSDIKVEPVYEAAEQKPVTTIIGASLVEAGSHMYNIVATRSVPEGYELVDYGFVFGKNLDDEDLDLDNVDKPVTDTNKGAVRATHGGNRNTASNEFAVNYGIKAKGANKIAIKSFITVVKDGETEIIYSDMFTQGYNE